MSTKEVTRKRDIPIVIKHDPWDGYFGRQFNDVVNSTIYKIKYFVFNNPGKVFLTGLGIGGVTGFLMGLQTGTLLGFTLARFSK
jgi:hypothetical protein